MGEHADKHSKKVKHINTLRKGDHDLVTLVIPGMPGIINGYFELARAIPGTGVVYGLQMKGLMGEEVLTNVKEMATHNIKLIRSIPSVKRIAIYAHSFGGTVAYEMLKQLKEEPYEVIHLVMIETFPLKKQAGLMKDFIIEFMKGLLSRETTDWPTTEKHIRQIADHPREKWPELYSQLIKDTVTECRQEFILILWNICERSLSATYQYSDRLEYAPTLIIAENQVGNSSQLEPTDWEDKFRDVRVLRSGGDHFTAVKEPHCSEWLSKLHYA